MPTILEQFQEMLDKALGKQANPPAPSPAPAAPTPATPTVEELSRDEISPALREFLANPQGAEELGELAAKIAQTKILEEKRKMHTVEFVSRLVGGTKDKPFGLRVPPKRVVAVLLSLPEAQAREVEKLLESCLDSAIDFAEHGFDADGFIQRPQLPENIKQYAHQWVSAGGTIQDFFKANPELGKLEDYNVSEFVKAKE